MVIVVSLLFVSFLDELFFEFLSVIIECERNICQCLLNYLIVAEKNNEIKGNRKLTRVSRGRL